jgi:diguanylate cyclase (GGDEF)-like protein
MQAKEWELWIQTIAGELGHLLITRTEFENVINDIISDPRSPAGALRFEIFSNDPFNKWVFGLEGQSTAETNSLRLEDSRQSLLRIDVWQSSIEKSYRSETLSRTLTQLFESFWKPALRTPSAGSFDLKRDELVRTLTENTIDYFYRKGENSSLIFCDLDNFGKVNKEASQAEGDRIIREFGALLESVVLDSGAVLHSGGDEFVVLFPGISEGQVLPLAFQIHSRVKAHDFQSGSVDLSVSMGVVSTGEVLGVPSLDELLAIANRGLHSAKAEGKKTARFAEMPVELRVDGAEESPHLQQMLTLGLCLIKSNLGNPEPFGNVWLNTVSAIARQADNQSREAVSERVTEFLEWARLIPTGDLTGFDTAERMHTNAPIASPVAVALAVAHGVLVGIGCKEHSGDERLVLGYSGDGRSASLRLAGSEPFWNLRTGDNPEVDHDFDLGSIWTFSETPKTSTSRSILVQIGHSAPPLPRTIFSERIVVDDRPTRGGGLPDFWEVTIARIVSHICANANVAVLYVYGNYEHGARTVEKLRQINTWIDEIEVIASRIAVTPQSIRRAAEILAGRVRFLSDDQSVADDLADLLRTPHHVQPIAAAKETRRRFLQRDLTMGDFGLRREDGCRVHSVAEAFPTVLEIVRHLDQSNTIRDQAGEEILELIDFKVHLSEPTTNRVPEFYDADSELLEEYFQSNFIRSDGLFAKAFASKDQLEVVLRHVISIIGNSRDQFATRRAILVIPHETSLEREVSPLGLVSVRLILRFIRAKVRIHYSFTWRTVEALVGFPYSLYGSVRLGEHLTSEIQRRLPGDRAKLVEMDEVSYVAHSLHMFVDEHGQNIARRIIEDASL